MASSGKSLHLHRLCNHDRIHSDKSLTSHLAASNSPSKLGRVAHLVFLHRTANRFVLGLQLRVSAPGDDRLRSRRGGEWREVIGTGKIG